VRSSSPVKRGKKAATRTQETGESSSSERVPVPAAR
jgi:hypothetical protein